MEALKADVVKWEIKYKTLDNDFNALQRRSIKSIEMFNAIIGAAWRDEINHRWILFDDKLQSTIHGGDAYSVLRTATQEKHNENQSRIR